VIDIAQFQAVDIRIGRVLSAADFPEARVPAWRLSIDFGPEVGVKQSSAQITHYRREELQGTLVVGVVNLPPRRVGPVVSEVLVLGALDEQRGLSCFAPTRTRPSDRGSGNRLGAWRYANHERAPADAVHVDPVGAGPQTTDQRRRSAPGGDAQSRHRRRPHLHPVDPAVRADDRQGDGHRNRSGDQRR
jgi:tRNA-binding protein